MHKVYRIFGALENEWYPRGIQISLHIRSPRFQAWGYSGVNFGHLKSEVFHLGGGYSRVNFGHLKSEVFHWGGVFRSKLWSSQIWSFSLGGGGLSGLKFQKEAFWRIWTKVYCLRNCTETCLCITDSLSHTTYVETNQNCSQTLPVPTQIQAFFFSFNSKMYGLLQSCTDETILDFISVSVKTTNMLEWIGTQPSVISV